MILSTSAIVLSLLIQDPIQPKSLEKLSKEVIETLIIAPSEASNLFNVATFNVPNTSPSVRIREAVSIQRTVLNSLATIRNERAIQQALSNSLAKKEEEDIKRAIELSNLTKIEEDDLRMAIENSLATKEEEDLKQAIELSKLTKIEEDKRRLETNSSLETTNPSVATPINITTDVAPQLEQSTVSERPIIVPESTLTAPQALQNEAPAEQAVLPQTAPVAPQPEQNTVIEKPAIVPNAVAVTPQLEQNESSAEPTAIPAAPIPPAPPMKILNKTSMPKVEKAKSLQKPSVLQETRSSKNLFNVLLQSKIAPQKHEEPNELTLTKETLINALKQRQDEISLSDQDLQLLEAQSLETLKPIIKEFYNKENKEWDFGFADQKSVMSYLAFAPKEEEAQEQTKNVGRLNIRKNDTDLLTAIREARGSEKNEEITTSSAPTITLLDSVKAVSAPSVATDIPQAPAAPKVLSSKAQDTLVKLKKNREAAKSDTGMTLLEQILNKDTLVKLQTPAPKTFELKEESSKSLNDFLNGSLSARRKSMEIDDELSDGEDWD